MVVHTAPYAVTWVLIRYRIPVDVFLIIFAADAVVFIARKFSSRNAQPADAGQALRRF
jgi:Tfp pilus assembly protein FimV